MFLHPQNALKSLAAGALPRPHWGAPNLLAGLNGPTSKGSGKAGRGRGGEKGEMRVGTRGG